MNKVVSSEYILQERKNYFLYTIGSRALPSLSDGLKPSQRRGLWMAQNEDKTKTATLAGKTMSIHPHAEISDVISNMAGPWSNNYPLFTGIGAFGTIINPSSYGAPRYTSVKVSDFTKEVVFSDIDIVPLQWNYDDTIKEPVFFLPLVPIALINPSFGIAGGFQCNILPYNLREVINAQISTLRGKEFKELMPYFKPTDNRAKYKFTDPRSVYTKFMFHGNFEPVSTTEIKIIQIPYGSDHNKIINHLIKLEEENKIVSFQDKSKGSIDINVKFPRGFLKAASKDQVLELLKLTNSESEIINVLDFDCESVLNIDSSEIITRFTRWRLTFYKQRYVRLLGLVQQDIQRYKDILLAIKHNIGGKSPKMKNKQELDDFLVKIGIVNVSYIASLPVYKFTEEERIKTEKNLHESLVIEREYNEIIDNNVKQTEIYIQELQNIVKRFC